MHKINSFTYARRRQRPDNIFFVLAKHWHTICVWIIIFIFIYMYIEIRLSLAIYLFKAHLRTRRNSILIIQIIWQRKKHTHAEFTTVTAHAVNKTNDKINWSKFSTRARLLVALFGWNEFLYAIHISVYYVSIEYVVWFIRMFFVCHFSVSARAKWKKNINIIFICFLLSKF